MAKALALKFRHWLQRRLKPVPNAVLTRKNVYTFPNGLGGMFLVLVTLMWVLGTNYQNNLVLALAYSLISIFVLAIIHAFLNLAGLQLRWLKMLPTYAGQPVEVWLEVSTRRKTGCDNIEIYCLGGDSLTFVLAPGETQKIALSAPAQSRGYCAPQLVCIQSHFPLGMIRCWTWQKLHGEGVIYPAPLALEEPLDVSHHSLNPRHAEVGLGEDFAGLKPYQPGDNLKKIAWKHWASGGELHTKHYATLTGGDDWLDWAHMAGANTETKLSGLCYWALHYHSQQQPFGLRLPGVEVPIASGEAHLCQCLTALALFGKASLGGPQP